MTRLVVLLVLLAPAVAWSEPSIRFSAEQHDFGNVLPGAPLEHPFTFTNDGTDELIIKDVNTS
jgi:hypothetical protein